MIACKPFTLEPPKIQEVRPGPDTPQYGGKGVRHLSRLQALLPSAAVACESWGQAKLKNKLDCLEETIAEKYLMGIACDWYYLRIDGWVLAFWKDAKIVHNPGGPGAIHPVGWLDLRLVQAVEGYSEGGGQITGLAPFRVDVSLKTGCFVFRVQDYGQMNAWVRTISQAIAENMQQIRVKMDVGREIARVSHAQNRKFTAQLDARTHREVVKGGAGGNMQIAADHSQHYSMCPGRAKDLKTLWEKCVRRASVGQEMPEIFAAMFALYDFDGDNNLEVTELEVMLRELFVVRRKELNAALALQRQYVLNADRLILGMQKEEELWQSRVGGLGKKLQAHYDGMLHGEGLDNRVHLLRSQLDHDHDGVVTLSEFMRRATYFLLPRQELMEEAQFYQRCEESLARSRHGHDSDDEHEEGGCLQQ